MAHGSLVSSSNLSDCATAFAPDSGGTHSKMSKLKIGDTVMWCGWFGAHAPKPAVVTGMEVTKQPRDKYGKQVKEVDWSLVEDNRVCFMLDNGHWAYSDQISPMP